MPAENTPEEKAWNKVKEQMGDRQLKFGKHWSYNLFNDPKRLAFVLSRYKFAAKMLSRGKRILELGCSEGIGVPILAEQSLHYTGVDMDKDAIEAARRNWVSDKIEFIEDDFMGKQYGEFDAVVSLDVIEHIRSQSEHLFFDAIKNNLGADGIAVVGTPNSTSAQYASVASQLGHVNLFDASRLRQGIEKIFYNVFMFSVNDEIVHTGFLPMAHYLICIGCGKRSR
jgi:2-polyprenyl-3-methyl-5-hydroxy-6-metoxy-1,4-benzoquinol methylase